MSDPVPPDALIEWTSLHGAEEPAPDLVVHGDGRVTVSGRFGDGRPVETRLAPDRVRCLLRAQDIDNVTVGRLDLEVPPSADRTVALAVVVPTARLATNGELEECTAVGRE